MCNDCGKVKCCCPEKRVSVLGKKGDPGQKGNSSYIYVAYASDVVPGTPDVVTDFSTTVVQCWVAVITSLIPLTPVEANFQGLWFNRCVSPCTCDITGAGNEATIDQTIQGATYVTVTGSTTPTLAAGTYLFWGELNVGLEELSYVETVFRNTALAVQGVSRLDGSANQTQPNQEVGRIVINKKIVIAAPTEIHLASRLVYGTAITVKRRSIQYIKIA